MFKLLVLATLVAVSLAAPADQVVSKSTQQTTVEKQNDPLNPYDDTVVKKTSTQETVKTADGSTSVVDKATVASLYNPYGPGFNPYSPFYNPYNLYSPYAYGSVYTPSSPYYTPNPLSPLNPLSPAFSPYTPYNPYAPLNYNSYSARAYYAY